MRFTSARQPHHDRSGVALTRTLAELCADCGSYREAPTAAGPSAADPCQSVAGEAQRVGERPCSNCVKLYQFCRILQSTTCRLHSMRTNNRGSCIKTKICVFRM
jgi:hypothetical protein